MPNWAQTFLGVDRAACCWIGCFPFQLEHGSKRELKLWTMLAEIKVKWYSADPLAHAKEPFLHGSMPTCVHLPKLAELEPFGDFPDRGLCKKCADRLNDRIRQDLHRVIKAEKILLSWEEDWDEETITTWKELYSSEPAIAEAHQEKQKAFIELMLGKTPFLIPPR